LVNAAADDDNREGWCKTDKPMGKRFKRSRARA
jgi:hypothetical protein